MIALATWMRWCFFSPSGVESFSQALQRAGHDAKDVQAKCLAIGQPTAEALWHKGYPLVFQGEQANLPGLLATIVHTVL